MPFRWLNKSASEVKMLMTGLLYESGYETNFSMYIHIQSCCIVSVVTNTSSSAENRNPLEGSNRQMH